jgi:esterase
VVARLHYELVADGTPRQWLAMLHGICGSGANLRGIARKVVTVRPTWGIALVDLRGHGNSEDGDPPHTLAACADDVFAAPPVPIAAIAGHSFGGKVALVARGRTELRHALVLDASPSARPRGLGDGSEVAALLATMAALPATWRSRADYVAAVVAAGHRPALAQWLAMSLRRRGELLVSRLDVAQIREMLADYDACDAWDALGPPGDVDVLAATRGSALDDDDVARLAAMVGVTVQRVDAGHWLHVDAPDVVVAWMAGKLAG